MPDQPFARKLEFVDSDELYSQYQECDRWAVIVGISKYQDSSLNLRYADRDAEDLYQLLLTPNGGSFKSDHIRKLTNEQATTRDINLALRSFLKKPAREDLVLIYFACHGSTDPDRPGDVYLLTYDTDPDDVAGTALPMEDIHRALRGILHSEKVIILADTCHSAAIGGGIGGRRSVGSNTQLVNWYLRDISSSKGGVALLTSAEANEVSFEDIRWGGGHGVFTHYLLEGMRGAADRDGNGIVTIGELFEYVRDNVKQDTGYRQHPSIGTNGYDRSLPIAIAPNSNFSHSSRTYQQIPNTQTSRNSAPRQTYQENLDTTDTACNHAGNQPRNLFCIHCGVSLRRRELIKPYSSQPVETDILASEKGVDYTRLRDLLKTGGWEEADQETYRVMSQAIGEEVEDWYDSDRLRYFPSTDLKTIDRLWVKYSKGHFGFSVQKQIYTKCGAKLNGDFAGDRTWKKFSKTVGWLENGIWIYSPDLIYSTSAPKGHLPGPPCRYRDEKYLPTPSHNYESVPTQNSLGVEVAVNAGPPWEHVCSYLSGKGLASLYSHRDL